MRKKISLGVYSLVLLWVLTAVFSMHVPPKSFWPAGFIALSLPLALILNLVFLLRWTFRKSWKALMPLLLLVLTWGYHGRGMALNIPSFQSAPAESPGQIQVLSYNVRIFNTYAHLQDKNQMSSRKMIRWVAQHPADVFCLQEFYNEPRSAVFNSVSKIGRNHDRHTFISRTLVNHAGAEFGLAIFSRYPIIHKGTIRFGKLTQNHAMFADLKINGDTVRVYNFHFQSMSIEEKQILDTYTDQDHLKKQGRNLLRRLKQGFVKRSDQVSLLLDHIQESPHPVILCGDLNDLPYSYTYERLSEDLKNAFEEKGLGFGASYNGRIPFVRIDNQFCSPAFQVMNFTLHDTISWSDHYPITATYRLPTNL